MKEFPACPRCASINLRMPGIRDGTVYYWQNLSEYACEDCELRAVPLWFEDLEAFQEFRDEKIRERASAKP